MPEKLRIKCGASLEALPEITGQVLSSAKNFGLTKKRLGELELALEEAIVNVINFAYPNNDGDIEIVISTDNSNSFTVQIIDEGIPFNPLDAPDPDLDIDITDRPIGGLGIFLIKQMMDDVKYRRENNKNILELVIKRET